MEKNWNNEIKENILNLCKKINYFFANEQLIIQALTHKSKKATHNERLEFLGDSILNFVITNILYNQFPYANEGELSLYRMFLVREITLIDIAKKLDLKQYIIVSSCKQKTNLRLLGNCVEALIGAIYLDSDINTVKKCILEWYYKKLRSLKNMEQLKDPKSRLQEYMQKQQILPTYCVIKSYKKDAKDVFVVELSLDKLEKTFVAFGNSIKSAEQSAAVKALQNIKIKKIRY